MTIKLLKNYFKQINLKNIYNFYKVLLLKLKLNFQLLKKKYPKFFQRFQVTLIYSVPFLELLYSTIHNVYTIGYFPELLKPFFLYFYKIFVSSFFNFLGNPDQAFLISYLAMELFLVHEIFHLSNFIKYHIVLANFILMIQNLVIAYWDFFFNREVFIGVSKWVFDDGIVLVNDPFLSALFFLNIFFLFFSFYIYFYIIALQGKFVNLSYFNWLTDSAAFWARIKTPTMRKKKVKK
jgi:hypothetical protein